jgi:DNA-binding protein H-NS
VGVRRHELETELSKLFGPRGAVAPKYRNPDNPSETWAGRGLKPRWLAAATKGGKKLEDFAIGSATKSPPAKKARKKRNA